MISHKKIMVPKACALLLQIMYVNLTPPQIKINPSSF